MKPFSVGILGLQGDVDEHVKATSLALQEEGLEGSAIEVKRLTDFERCNALVIPGGESTVIGWLSAFNKLLPRIRERVQGGMPVLGTCAGLIMLAKRTYDRTVGQTGQPLFGILDITVERNAFGRQRESFEIELNIPAIGPQPFRGVFIRAPVITEVGPGVETLTRTSEGVVAVRSGKVLGTAFHPELSGDLRFHRYFIRSAASI